MIVSAPPESFAYVTMHNPGGANALAVLDVDHGSKAFARQINRIDMPYAGDELHHFGWNACGSSPGPFAALPHAERRYLVVPGLRSSRIHVLDTKSDPAKPRLVKTIEPGELARKTGYSRPHTTRSGPDGIYVNTLGAADGTGAGGIFVINADTFEIEGPWLRERGPQFLAYDFTWHLGHDTMITSELGTPDMVERGVNPELLLAGKYGHRLHVWDLRTRRHRQVLDLGAEQQMVLDLRPAHDPTKLHGFTSVVMSLKNLSSSIWVWYRSGSEWAIKKVIEIPAEPADPADLPPVLKGFKAVPPLVTGINLSLDDRQLYVSCWGTGELRQYDVSDPFEPRLTGSIHIGGIVRRATHPYHPGTPLNGGPQAIEISRDGKRVYCTNSLYESWDEQFYPDGVRGWIAKIDASPEGCWLDSRFFVDTGTLRPRQIHLDGGDASSDSYLYS